MSKVHYVTGVGKLKSAGKSLSDFASSQNRLAGCRICALPTNLITQIDNSPGIVGTRTISLWLLKEHGVKVSRDLVRKHLAVCREVKGE